MAPKKTEGHNRSFILFCLFLTGTLLFPAPSPADRKGDILRLRLTQAPTTLIPHISTGYKDRIASRIVYEPLASYDMEGNLVPILAAEIPSLENGGLSPDGKSVTWRLKPAVQWADGQPFTADDVRFTYDFITALSPEGYSSVYYESVESVEKVDDLTVRIVFKNRNPRWAQPFVGDGGAIVPRHIFKNYLGSAVYKAPQKLAAVGTGPYRLLKFKKEEMLLIGDDLVSKVRIIYKRNSRFREKGKPFFRRLELLSTNDYYSAAESVMKDGSSDFTWSIQRLNKKEMARLKTDNAKGRFLYMPDPKVERIMFNFSDPKQIIDPAVSETIRPNTFFKDKRVRKAFAYTIDRKAIAAIYGGKARPASNLIVTPDIFNSPNTRHLYPLNLERAAVLLDAAGWKDVNGDHIREKNGVRLSVVYQTSVNPLRQKIQKIVKKNLEAVGVEVKLKFIDPSIFFNNAPSNSNSLNYFNADMQEYSFGNSFPDPAAYLGLWICSREPSKQRIPSLWNKWQWCNESFDALGRRLFTELDPNKRREICIRMNDLIVKEAAVVPLVNTQKIYAVSRSLKGVELTPWDRETWEIKDWRRK